MDVDMTKQKQKSEDGFMIIEAMLLLIAFIVFSTYLFNFFTAIHTGIVNQTHARSYLFETFQHRVDLHLKRAEADPKNDLSRLGYRFHGVINDQVNTSGGEADFIASDVELGRVGADDIQDRTKETKFIQLKTGYGYCLTKGCQ